MARKRMADDWPADSAGYQLAKLNDAYMDLWYAILISLEPLLEPLLTRVAMALNWWRRL